MIGRSLADKLGASELLYAAVAYFSFDEEFYAQSMIDANPELEEEIMWWLDDIYSNLYNLFGHIRTYHHGKNLEHVVFDDEGEALYVSGTARALLPSRRRLSSSRRVLRSHSEPDECTPW
jgi:hypothetical protein